MAHIYRTLAMFLILSVTFGLALVNSLAATRVSKSHHCNMATHYALPFCKRERIYLQSLTCMTTQAYLAMLYLFAAIDRTLLEQMIACASAFAGGGTCLEPCLCTANPSGSVGSVGLLEGSSAQRHHIQGVKPNALKLKHDGSNHDQLMRSAEPQARGLHPLTSLKAIGGMLVVTNTC